MNELTKTVITLLSVVVAIAAINLLTFGYIIKPIKNDIIKIEESITDIKDNHLAHIEKYLEQSTDYKRK